MGKKAEKKRLNKKSKSFLVFDEGARKEWLTGFGKRKKERQQKAKDDLAKMLKEEKVRQREQFREKLKKHETKYMEKLQEMEEILQEKTKAYECGGKTVEITEYDLTSGECMLGVNSGSNPEENIEEDCSNPDAEEKTHVTKFPKRSSQAVAQLTKRIYKLNQTRSKRLKDSKLRQKSKQGWKGKQTKSEKRGK